MGNNRLVIFRKLNNVMFCWGYVGVMFYWFNYYGELLGIILLN